MNQTLPMGAGSGGSGSQDIIEARKGKPQYSNIKNRQVDMNTIQNPNGLQILQMANASSDLQIPIMPKAQNTTMNGLTKKSSSKVIQNNQLQPK
jgi:hypothetical protein